MTQGLRNKDSVTVQTADDFLTALQGVFCDRILNGGYGQHILLLLPQSTFIYGTI
jgi:hypothetical protein